MPIIQNPKAKYKSMLNKLATVLIVSSTIILGLIFLVPFLSLSITQKGIIIPTLIIIAEASWWIGIAILGKQFAAKYRKKLNPFNWFSKNPKGSDDNDNDQKMD